MNLNLLFIAASLASYAEEIKAEESKKESTQKKEKIQKKENGPYKQQAVYTCEINNPDLTANILTILLKSCEKKDILNYVNVSHEGITSDKELYHAQHDFQKTRRDIWIHSAFEAKASSRGDKGAIKNLDEALGLNLDQIDDQQLYNHVRSGSVEDECTHCDLLIFYGPVDRKATAYVYCDTIIDLDDRKKEKLVEEIAQKVSDEKQQAK